MKYYATLDDHEYECTLEEEGGAIFITVAGKRYCANLAHIGRTRAFSLVLDGASFEFTLDEQEDHIELSGGAGHFHIGVLDARTHAARAKTAGARAVSGPRTVKAQMPGIVRELKVALGDKVEKGQPLLILEAMKMQNDIRSDRPGVVKALHVAAGDTVEKGAKLVDVE
jgi:biotin carboxyl carrier protein